MYCSHLLRDVLSRPAPLSGSRLGSTPAWRPGSPGGVARVVPRPLAGAGPYPRRLPGSAWLAGSLLPPSSPRLRTSLVVSAFPLLLIRSARGQRCFDRAVERTEVFGGILLLYTRDDVISTAIFRAKRPKDRPESSEILYTKHHRLGYRL